jgi:hypothetical protein
MSKWKTRSAKPNGAHIRCPKHGLQPTYDLYAKGEVGGLGCARCFEKLPIKVSKVLEKA